MIKISVRVAIVFAFALVASSVQAEPRVLEPRAICRIVHERAKHLGETLTFRGELLTDHIERALIRPIGCEKGIGLGEMTPAAQKLVDDADPPIWLPGRRRIVGLFTGTLIRGEPNGSEFIRDDGVRLNVTVASHLEVFEAFPLPRSFPGQVR